MIVLVVIHGCPGGVFVYDQILWGGRGGGWGGGSSEGCLKWGGGGSLRDLSKNILKQGLGKGESCSKGGGGF